jgi:hypothetical protein
MGADAPMILAALLAVVAVVAGVSLWRAERRRILFLREAGVMLGGYFAYFAVRGATEGDAAAALHHAQLIVDFERHIGIWVEPTLQALVLDIDPAITAANWVYIWGHWPVIGGVALWLFFRRPDHYLIYRNAILISGALGLVMFVTFPAAPPRLADLGLTDTVVNDSNFYHLLQPPQLTNQYAAFPSLHFGWNLLIGLALLQTSRSVSVRIFGILMPLAMLAAIVLTANHYLIDAAAGAAVALIGLAAARYLHRRTWSSSFRWLRSRTTPPTTRPPGVAPEH